MQRLLSMLPSMLHSGEDNPVLAALRMLLILCPASSSHQLLLPLPLAMLLSRESASAATTGLAPGCPALEVGLLLSPGRCILKRGRCGLAARRPGDLWLLLSGGAWLVGQLVAAWGPGKAHRHSTLGRERHAATLA